MIRFIPGTDPLDPRYHSYTQAERDDLVRFVQAKTSPGRLSSSRGTTRHWEKYRAAKAATEAQTPIRTEPTTPARVAARLVALTGWPFAAAAWALTDITGRYVPQDAVGTQWRRMYAGSEKAGGPRGAVGVDTRRARAQKNG